MNEELNPKVIDADGAVICEGDTVWTLSGVKRVVAKVGNNPTSGMIGWDGSPWVMFDNGSWTHAKHLTHREPDTRESERTCRNIAVPPKDDGSCQAQHFKCSECGRLHVSIDCVHYCPGCGAKVALT